jgi:hypothetical protein
MEVKSEPVVDDLSPDLVEERLASIVSHRRSIASEEPSSNRPDETIKPGTCTN